MIIRTQKIEFENVVLFVKMISSLFLLKRYAENESYVGNK